MNTVDIAEKTFNQIKHYVECMKDKELSAQELIDQVKDGD